jgi:allophanate hydrolase subunit 2
MTGLEVVVAGPATTVQDLGRPGYGAYGVPEGGAMDQGLAVLANRRAGNPESAPALEFVLTGPTLRWTGRRRLRCVVAGDGVSEVTLARGDELAVEALRDPEVMGARGTCLPGGFGGFLGRELQAGDVLPVGRGRATSKPRAGERRDPMPVDGDHSGGDLGGQAVTLRVLPGDRAAARARTFRSLLAAQWVAGDGNRVGLRLQGPSLSERQLHLSQPIPPGAVQVSGAGQPILLLRDHPTVGGYPVIAVVVRQDLDLGARLRPGTPVRFVPA